MAKQYLDKNGLTYLWGKLKAYFQQKLVSGTNIKTVNNQSLLGSGNISISGGGSDVTGVKGNEESSYRTGDVNLTPANIGAIPIGSNGIYLDNADSGTKTISANSTADFSWTYTVPTGYRAIVMSANVRSVGNNYGHVRIFGLSSSISGQTTEISCGSRNDSSSNATKISIRARILVIKDS